MPIYADYLSVNQDFQPVFSQDEDRLHPEAWKGFIPHDAWVRVLEAVVRALERATATDRRPLLLHGAYGTGKTFAAFVLKHLLQDDWQDVQSYISARPDLQRHEDLCRRLQRLREAGDYLVVYRSGSAHITNSFILLAEIQEGVRRALIQRGIDVPITDTLYQAVLAKLAPADSSVNWQAVFKRHRAEFLDCSDAEDVVRRLSTGAADGSGADLMARVLEALSAEGFSALGDPESVKTWVGEVIRAAGITGIIFMWDEFTEYFRQNRSTTTLQDLAELSARVPFYLFLVTHKSLEVARQFADPSDWKRLVDRFTVVSYEMAVVTAYKLMAGAIIVNPERREEWESWRERTWGGVAVSAGQLVRDGCEGERRERTSGGVAVSTGQLVRDGREGERREDFKALLPIHPYTAFLLSTISRQFSSSQRTLFQWLRMDQDGSFPRFLTQELRGDGPLLTAESLWDYFFLDENLDLADSVRDIVSYYRSRADDLESEQERRALRAVLLLLALERQMGQIDPRLHPREQNIVHMLVGTGQAREVLEAIGRLVELDVVRQLPGDAKEYTIAAGNVDHERVREIEKGLPGFATLVQTAAGGQGQVADEVRRCLVIADAVTSRRLQLAVVAAETFLNRRERVAEVSAVPYQLGVLAIVGLDEEELRRAETLAESLSPASLRTIIAVIGAPFGRQRLKDWQRERAHALYYYGENRDPKNAKVHEDRAARLMAAWGDEVRAASMRVAFRDVVQLAEGASGYAAFVRTALDVAYPHRLERIWPTATLYRESYSAQGAAIGLEASSAGSNPYKDLVADLRAKGLWDKATYRKALERDPGQPLAELQRAVDEEFAGGSAVSLRDLWHKLQGEPYGLMPSPIGILIMGLLLRDYCDGYYRRDGITSFPLSRDDLADRLKGVMHGRGDAEICRMSAAAQTFCELLTAVFALAPGQADYPDRARAAAREAVQHLGYPVWLLRLGAGAHLAPSVGAIESLLADTSDGNVALEEASLASFNRAVKPQLDALRRRLSAGGFEEAMRCYLEAACPGVLVAARKLGIGLGEVMGQLRALLQQEVWLWRETEVRERLPELAGRLELTMALNELLGGHDHDLDGAIAGLRERLRQGRLPLAVFADIAADAADTITKLSVWVRREGQRWSASELAAEVQQHKERLRRALASPEAALRAWANAKLELDLGVDDGEELWRRLGDYSDRPELELRQETRRLASEVQRSRAAIEVQDKWRRLTGARSPREWSHQHAVPIEWLCDSPELLRAVGHLDGLSSLGQAELAALSALLDERADWLRRLGEEASVDAAFAGLVPEFEGVLTADDMQIVKHQVRVALGPDTAGWGRDEARKAAHGAVSSSYVERMLPRVESHIDSLPAEEARSLLRELAREPAVGLRLLRRRGQRQ